LVSERGGKKTRETLKATNSYGPAVVEGLSSVKLKFGALNETPELILYKDRI